MDRLIEQHLAAERAGDADASVAVYTDDVEHDVVGAPHGPLQGRDAARGFYEQLNREIKTESMTPTRTYHACGCAHGGRGRECRGHHRRHPSGLGSS